MIVLLCTTLMQREITRIVVGGMVATMAEVMVTTKVIIIKEEVATTITITTEAIMMAVTVVKVATIRMVDTDVVVEVVAEVVEVLQGRPQILASTLKTLGRWLSRPLERGCTQV